MLSDVTLFQEINLATGQPLFKVCMLCGAPGLGKTTLAHVLARHAGYHVIEVNASDDRSPELFAKIIGLFPFQHSAFGFFGFLTRFYFQRMPHKWEEVELLRWV